MSRYTYSHRTARIRGRNQTVYDVARDGERLITLADSAEFDDFCKSQEPDVVTWLRGPNWLISCKSDPVQR